MTNQAFWSRVRVGCAEWLMAHIYKHRLDIADSGGVIVAVIFSRDQPTFDYNFTVKPRYHVMLEHPDSEHVH